MQTVVLGRGGMGGVEKEINRTSVTCGKIESFNKRRKGK